MHFNGGGDESVDSNTSTSLGVLNVLMMSLSQPSVSQFSVSDIHVCAEFLPVQPTGIQFPKIT